MLELKTKNWMQKIDRKENSIIFLIALSLSKNKYLSFGF